MIHIIGVAAFKPEDDAPVGRYPYRIEIAEVACEGVEPVSRDIDVFHSVRSIYRRKPVLDFGNLIRGQSPRDPFLERRCNRLLLKLLIIINCQLSVVNVERRILR